MNSVMNQPGLQGLPTKLQGRQVLVIGLSPAANQSVVQPLRDLGINARGFTRPEQAGARFDAAAFELIAFGRGALGPVSDRLKRDFSEQNPHIRFVDVIQPVAFGQILAALAHDPHTPRFVSDFEVFREGGHDFAGARILAPCRIVLTIYRLARVRNLVGEVLPGIDVSPGPFRQRIDSRLSDANSLLLVADEEEYHLHPFLAKTVEAQQRSPRTHSPAADGIAQV